MSKMYDLEKIRFEDIFAGSPPTFAQTQNKKAVLNKNKKGQFTLDGWIKEERVHQAKVTIPEQNNRFRHFQVITYAFFSLKCP